MRPRSGLPFAKSLPRPGPGAVRPQTASARHTQRRSPTSPSRKELDESIRAIHRQRRMKERRLEEVSCVVIAMFDLWVVLLTSVEVFYSAVGYLMPILYNALVGAGIVGGGEDLGWPGERGGAGTQWVHLSPAVIKNIASLIVCRFADARGVWSSEDWLGGGCIGIWPSVRVISIPYVSE